MENHTNREGRRMPFLFDGHSNAPHSTENAQYMALATFPSVFQRLVLLCQEALLGPASYLVKGSKFSTRQGSHDGTRTRFTGFFHGTSVLFMRQDHRNRLNLTNFQRYLLRLGLNFVKTPTNEGTLYASPKNIDFMKTDREVKKKKDGTIRRMERSKAPLGPVSQRILVEGPIRDANGLENILSFSFWEFASITGPGCIHWCKIPRRGSKEPSSTTQERHSERSRRLRGFRGLSRSLP